MTSPHLSREAPQAGSLIVVGTGLQVGGQMTPLGRSYLERADRVLFLVAEPFTAHWIVSLRPDAESMDDCYRPGRRREEVYEEMTERILDAVRGGAQVCAAFYGHPGIFVGPSHEAVRRARKKGFEARMLPGVSAADCLFADLGVDPSRHGCQTYEATDLVLRPRQLDPRAATIVWQIGAVGVDDYREGDLWSREGLGVLAEVLRETYPADHRCVVYESAVLPHCDPLLFETTLSDLPSAPVTIVSTLWVPAVSRAPVDDERRRRLESAASSG